MVSIGEQMRHIPELMKNAYVECNISGTPVITSAAEFYNWRNIRSLHLTGLALDFRGRDMTLAELKAVCAYMQARLGDDYDVVLEFHGEGNGLSHIHIEFDPD